MLSSIRLVLQQMRKAFQMIGWALTLDLKAANYSDRRFWKPRRSSGTGLWDCYFLDVWITLLFKASRCFWVPGICRRLYIAPWSRSSSSQERLSCHRWGWRHGDCGSSARRRRQAQSCEHWWRSESWTPRGQSMNQVIFKASGSLILYLFQTLPGVAALSEKKAWLVGKLWINR